jgi:4-amino-4-deoxy-L-arabinose transferase-like glycosyltransferase
LRLYFVSTFPAQGSGDAPFYIELAWNWLKKGIYGFPIDGALTPVDMRVPGYPAFLAAIFTFAGKSEHAVMLVQVFVDLATCVLIALIAARLAPEASRRRVALAALWLTALCPFTANYTAVVLTETLVTFLTALALLVLLEAYRESTSGDLAQPETGTSRFSLWFLGGIVVGFGTLVRPETPLLVIAVGLVLLARWRRVDWGKLLRAALLMGLGLFLPLLPWAARNWNTLHDVQFLAPHYSELPGEFAPLGFNAWINTWQWRFRDVYTTTWKLDVESISMNDIPASAFDTPEQRARATEIFNNYNNTLTWERDQDAAFGEIAREIRSRHPLRTYLKIPFLRAVTIWFQPRIELLPYSGNLFPVRREWREDRRDFRATLTLVSADLIYIALALAGLWIARRSPGIAILVLFILVRTIYFSTFADESPEPRYVLECFPAVIALGAQVFRRRSAA